MSEACTVFGWPAAAAAIAAALPPTLAALAAYRRAARADRMLDPRRRRRGEPDVGGAVVRLGSKVDDVVTELREHNGHAE